MSFSERPQAAIMSNPRADRVRDVARLAGRSARSRQGLFLAEGPQSVREALVAHRERLSRGEEGLVTELYASQACLDRYPELAAGAEGVRTRIATDEVLAAMADTVNPQGIVAVCRFLHRPLDEVLDAGPRLLAVLCQVRDPGNAGTVLRAADAAGADAVIYSGSSVDIYNPKAVRSTAGSLFHLPVVTGVDVADLAARCAERGIGILAADGYGTLDLDELQDASAARRLGASGSAAPDGEQAPSYDLASPTAWFFGNEAQGLAPEELALSDHRVAVPVYGSAESLNLGTAATVCLYASARAQRR
ncbi:RNA methyltransferase [Arthrobacter sp. Y-9]|uniref:TrmH family RNA methyltransferase n=1 Tax=Arthrobacter sp. Y-9 TaxID=3039385 RepID=UPI00241DF741|nr:RNA methyltransferase [Arthrobacter sp. Y-9]WFR85127.1 RNA methyltransferase [Arthrobacter sp. Y-9]